MKLFLSTVKNTFDDKARCRPENVFKSEPVEIDLTDTEKLREFFTSKIHSAWQYVGTRSVKNTTTLLAVPFDFDNGEKSFDEIVEQFKQYDGVVYTSSSHSEKHPKIRVLLTLTTPITNVDAFQSLCSWLKKEYPTADRQVFKVSQPLFPCCKFDDGKETTGFPLFRLQVLKGESFTFPPEAFALVDKNVKRSTGWEPPPLTGKRGRETKAGLNYLLNLPVDKGDRDDEALLRAAECRKVGLSENDCLIALFTWNTLNKPPLGDSDIRRITKSAFTGEGYDFGTNNDSLRTAREQGHKVTQKQKIDVEKFLSDDEEPSDTEEEEKHVRRSRTVTELLAGGADLTMPETVGEYISWRKRITLLAGREKYSGKSTLCTFEAMAALRKGYRVLWISPDEPREDILYRLVEAGVREYAEQCEIAGDLDVPHGWTELEQMIISAKPDLIILDSIHSILPMINKSGKVPDSSESAEWHTLVAYLRPLAVKLNAAIVWIHHVTKATGQAAGSFGIAAAVDAVVTISPVQKENRRKLAFVGRRVNSSMDCALDYLDAKRGYERVKDWGKSMERESEQSKAEQVFNWLREFMDLRQDEYFTKHDMDEAFRNQYNTDPRNSNALRNALKKMRDDGEIVQDKSKGGFAKTAVYRIVNRKLKPSDLIGKDNDDDE